MHPEALDHTAINAGHVEGGQGFVVKGAGANQRYTPTNHLHSPHAPDLIIIGKKVREAQQSETVLASPLPMMLSVVDQILTFASYLIE